MSNRVDPTTLRKGKQGGICQRTACSNTPACYRHVDRDQFYCAPCAKKIMELNAAPKLFVYEGPDRRLTKEPMTPYGDIKFVEINLDEHAENKSYCQSQREKAICCKSLRMFNFTGSEHLAALITKKFGVIFPRDRVFDVEYNRVVVTNAIMYAIQEACLEDRTHYRRRKEDPTEKVPDFSNYLREEDPHIPVA